MELFINFNINVTFCIAVVYIFVSLLVSIVFINSAILLNNNDVFLKIFL